LQLALIISSARMSLSCVCQWHQHPPRGSHHQRCTLHPMHPMCAIILQVQTSDNAHPAIMVPGSVVTALRALVSGETECDDVCEMHVGEAIMESIERVRCPLGWAMRLSHWETVPGGLSNTVAWEHSPVRRARLQYSRYVCSKRAQEDGADCSLSTVFGALVLQAVQRALAKRGAQHASNQGKVIMSPFAPDMMTYTAGTHTY
jgi:hypothetical protein